MKRTRRFEPHSITHHRSEDGSLLLQSTKQLGAVAHTLSDWLQQRASQALSRVFIGKAQRSGLARRNLYLHLGKDAH